MTEAERKKVQHFLRSIRKAELAVIDLNRAIEDLDTRRESPPTWMINLESAGVSGGIGENRLETWAEFIDTYEARRSFLREMLRRNARKVEDYKRTMEALAHEDNYGCLAVEIINLKYYRKVPDEVACRYHLFCAKRTYYRTHVAGLIFFCEALPSRFTTMA